MHPNPEAPPPEASDRPVIAVSAPHTRWRRFVRAWRRVDALLMMVFAVAVLILPGLTVAVNLADPALRGDGVPRIAWKVFRTLTPKYEQWARRRVASGRARDLSTKDISGTEWPVFGSVFYLWAVEGLQEAWIRDPSVFPEEPAKYAREAVLAASDLVLDPGHAGWVRKHWGENHLHRENVFYRALLIAAATVRERLTGDARYRSVLVDQVETLSRDLDASPYGLLDDYPFECYPADVLAATAIIRDADRLLGTDHSAFAERQRRGFVRPHTDTRDLVPYFSDARTGEPMITSRGCGNSYVNFIAPRLWPDRARVWYAGSEQHFWRTWGGLQGFAEFADGEGSRWYWDVDSGPVIGGIGVAASAFGLAGARMNGRFDHAYPLAAEMLAFSWPLPDGTLLTARILSNSVDAPYLGEACLLFNLSRTAEPGFEIRRGGRLPPVVYGALATYQVLGLLLLMQARRNLRRLAAAAPATPSPSGKPG